MNKIIVIVATALMLAGCSVGGHQEFAGINKVSFDWCKVDGQMLPCEVRIIDGKEQGAIDFSFQMPDGTILNFAADNVKAFRGQELRAAVDKALIEAYGEALPSVAESIVKALSGGAL